VKNYLIIKIVQNYEKETISELLKAETALREELIHSGSSTMDLINELIEVSIEIEKNSNI